LWISHRRRLAGPTSRRSIIIMIVPLGSHERLEKSEDKERRERGRKIVGDE
jgi:hypothetical protein